MGDRKLRPLCFAVVTLVLPACGAPSGHGPAMTSQNTSAVYSDPGIETFPDEGHTHVPVGTVITYMTDPPTSGAHYPYPAAGGFYDTAIDAGFLVHAMEHGGVIFYYSPAVTDAQKNTLRALAAAHPGIYGQVICVPRNDPTYALILTAWTHRLRLATYDQGRIDVFLGYFLAKGPESAPDSPWGDPFTDNTTATPFFDPNPELTVTDTLRPGSMFTDSGITTSAQPITVSVNLDVSAASTLPDTMELQIRDAASSAVVARAVYDAQSGTIRFSVGDTSLPVVPVSPGVPHAVTFSVDAGHHAFWAADGSGAAGVAGFGTASVTIAYVVTFAAGSAAAPEFQFGNPVISHP